MVAQLRPSYGWSTCATINAKNSYGAYTGVQIWWFFIQNGKVVRSQNTSETKQVMRLAIPGTLISRGHNVSCEEGKSSPTTTTV